MKKTAIILGVISVTIILYCAFYSQKKYNFPLNTVEKVKYFEPTEKKYAYQSIPLTPTEYSRVFFTRTLIAKAIYKDEIIGIKIVKPIAADKIIFKSIGKESDNFVKAISELYEENSRDNTVMRTEIKGSSWSMEYGTWNKSSNYYKIVMSSLNGKEADILLEIEIPERIISIGDKNNGLSKKRFVDVFRAIN